VCSRRSAATARLPSSATATKYRRQAVADFDPLGQKLQEDSDPKRQKPTLSKIDGMQFVDVARIERLENRDETIGGNIIPDYEGGQPNQADIVESKRPQRIAIANLDVSVGLYRSLHALLAGQLFTARA
jgi:hypothetical protein